MTAVGVMLALACLALAGWNFGVGDPALGILLATAGVINAWLAWINYQVRRGW